MPRHFAWNGPWDSESKALDPGYGSGRVAVQYCPEAQAIRYKKLAGTNPPVQALLPLLDAVLPADWRDVAEKCHVERVYPWALERSYHQYGSRGYSVRVDKDPEFRDAPIVAHVHVSCAHKLGEHIAWTWLGDLALLVPAIMKDYPQGRVWVEEVPLFQGEFSAAGTPSGILEKF